MMTKMLLPAAAAGQYEVKKSGRRFCAKLPILGLRGLPTGAPIEHGLAAATSTGPRLSSYHGCSTSVCWHTVRAAFSHVCV